jgi:hypothetical protein
VLGRYEEASAALRWTADASSSSDDDDDASTTPPASASSSTAAAALPHLPGEAVRAQAHAQAQLGTLAYKSGKHEEAARLFAAAGVDAWNWRAWCGRCDIGESFAPPPLPLHTSARFCAHRRERRRRRADVPPPFLPSFALLPHQRRILRRIMSFPAPCRRTTHRPSFPPCCCSVWRTRALPLPPKAPSRGRRDARPARRSCGQGAREVQRRGEWITSVFRVAGQRGARRLTTRM